jgi:hypothetical protein
MRTTNMGNVLPMKEQGQGKRSIGQQLLLAFSCTMLLSLTAQLAISLGYVFGTTNDIEDNSKQARKDQISRHSTDIINQNADVFAQYLNRAAWGGLLPIARAAQDALARNPYSMGAASSFYSDAEARLAAPITYDKRTNNRVSLSHSSFLLPSTPFSKLSAVSAAVQRVVDATAHLDPYFVPTVASNSDFLASYVGFVQGGVFRSYPGKVVTDLAYDPRQRPWFKLAQSDISSTKITEPYIDAFGLGWTLTVTQAILSGDATATQAGSSSSVAAVGAAGVDLSIDTIVANIQGITLFESGKVTLLLRETGTVVADKEWDAATATELFLYTDLKQPIVTDALWQSVQALQPGQTASTNDYTSGGALWSVTYHRLQQYSDFVQSEALVTVQQVVKDMRALQRLLLTALLLAFAGR